MSGTTHRARHAEAAAVDLRGTADRTRSFHLTVRPGPKDSYGIALAETGPGPDRQPETSAGVPLVTASPAQTARVSDAVVAAVRASGHTPGRLSTRRGAPIELADADGVRLAITLLAAQPVTVPQRVRAIVAGVAAMSVEETYYWYAKCVGPDAASARKALRILLADPKPGSHT